MSAARRPSLPEPDPLEGLLLVDKPPGLTSHDVVDRVRRHFGIAKVGHGGTLDPMATGLLVLLLGRGTKLSDRLLNSDKVYEGVLFLGVMTDSEDVEGRILEEKDASTVTAEQVEAEMRKRLGDQMQTPPMISAIKVDGVPLYKLARKGRNVERRPRLIHVSDFRLLDFAPPKASFRLACSKGTYVRTLCADIGRSLGCGAHLHALRRVQAGKLHLDAATPLDHLLEFTREQLSDRVMSIYDFLHSEQTAS